MWQIETIILLFLGAFAIATALTWTILKRVRTVGIDAPGEARKWHDKPISRLGGVPIFVALCAGFGALSIRQPEFVRNWMPIMLSNAIVFSVGFLDDLRPLGARVKLAGQVGAALILYALGVSIDVISNPFGEGGLELGWWGLPLTVLWLVAIPNIVNLIDGMDGLAAGFGMFLCMTLAAIGHFTFKTDIVLMSTVMAGAVAGFLLFNFPPAKIFLGDGGAYLIGFFVASVSLMSSNKGSIIGGLFVMVIALGVPILDTSFAILRRAVRGVPIFSADAEHIHHRLILLGYSKQQALIALYLVCLVLSLIGISILMTKGLAIPIAAAVVFLLALLGARYLGYVKSWSKLREQFSEALERRKKLEHAQSHARVLEIEVERCEAEAEFEGLLDHSLGRIGLGRLRAADMSPIRLSVPNAGVCTLYRKTDGEPDTRWRSRVDALADVLGLAHEKWPGLSFLQWELADEADTGSEDANPDLPDRA